MSPHMRACSFGNLVSDSASPPGIEASFFAINNYRLWPAETSCCEHGFGCCYYCYCCCCVSSFAGTFKVNQQLRRPANRRRRAAHTRRACRRWCGSRSIGRANDEEPDERGQRETEMARGVIGRGRQDKRAREKHLHAGHMRIVRSSLLFPLPNQASPRPHTD